MRDLKSRSARTDADVLALNKAQTGIGAVDQGFDSVRRRFDYVYQRFERIDVELAALRGELAEMRAENPRNLETVLTAISELRE
jgi:hypothetical protein